MATTITALIDHFKFKNYINVIGKEELLNLPNVDIPIFLKDSTNTITGDISDAIFSTSESPMYTADFIDSFGGIKNLGDYIKITFEDEVKIRDYNSKAKLNHSNYKDRNNETFDNRVLNYEVNSFEYNETLFKDNPPFVQGSIDNKTAGFSAGFKSTDANANVNVNSINNKSFSIRKTINLKDEDASINNNSSLRNPAKTSTTLSVFQMLDESVSLANRQTLELSVFFNTIPTIEFSRCVPLLSAQFLLPSSIVNQNSQETFHVANTADFLFGEGAGKNLSGMDPFRGTKVNRKLTSSTGTTVNQEGLYTTQDIFMSPQTLVNADTVFAGGSDDFRGDQRKSNKRNTTVIDKMRPFMTIESFDVDVKPTRGLLSYKSGQLNLILHDRSRMEDIAPFIKPDLFGAFGSEILLEYGWSHPDGTSPYGAFLNKMRSREKYMIVNSTINMTQNGEAKISLQIAMLGSTQILKKRPFRSDNLERLFKNLNEVVETMKSEVEGAPVDVSQASEIIASVGRIDKSTTNLIEISKSIKKNLNSLKSLRGRKSPGYEPFIRLSNMILNDIDNYAKEAQEQISGLNDFFDNGYDPFLSKSIQKKLKLLENVSDIIDNNKIKYITLGKLLTRFLGEALAKSGSFNEVQMMFYNLNSKCGKASSINIANIPIPVKDFKSFLNDNLGVLLNISLEQLVLMITNRFVSNKATILYGFDKIYNFDPKKNSAVRISRLGVKQAEAKQLSILYKDYYGLEDSEVKTILAGGSDSIGVLEKYRHAKVEFTMPRIAINSEVIGMGSNERDNVNFVSPEPMFSFITQKDQEASILRIHVYDTSNSPYESAYDLITTGIQNDFKRIQIGINSNRKDLIQLGKSGKNRLSIENTFSNILKNDLQVIGATSEADDNNTLKININNASPFGSIKNTYKRLLPTVTYGSQNSAIIDASFTTLNEGRLATVFITREDRNFDTRREDSTNVGNKTAVSIQADDLPLRVLPAKVDATIFGCPIINFAQHMFFDFGTGTSVDNVYTITGIKHSISQGKFTSGLTITYSDAYGKFEAKNFTNKMLVDADKALREAASRNTALGEINIREGGGISVSNSISNANIKSNRLFKSFMLGI